MPKTIDVNSPSSPLYKSNSMTYGSPRHNAGQGSAGVASPRKDNGKNLFRPEGKDYVVDLTHKDFPAILRGGRKLTSIGGEIFNLPERFSIVKRLGLGSYATVVAAQDTQRPGELVAVKKCRFVFARPGDGKRLLREVKLLRGLHHKNVLKLYDILLPLEAEFDDLYVVTEKMDFDLYHYQQKRSLPEEQVKPIMYQVLQALKYIHSACVVHRDLKPDNILLRQADGAVKLCDFNHARGFEPDAAVGAAPMTANISTKWYRSPELLVENRRYTSASDIWSLGCIFAEMLTGRTLFEGETQTEILHNIVEGLEVAPDADLSWVESDDVRASLKGIVDSAQAHPRTHIPVLDRLPPATSSQARTFLLRMLKLNPKERPTAEQLLQDPFLQEYYSPAACPASSHIFKWKYDDQNPSDDTLRKLFWREIYAVHPEADAERQRNRSGA